MRWILTSVLFFSVGMVESSAEARKITRRVAADVKPMSDVVKKLRDDDEGIVVTFEKTAGSYYLRRDVAEFESYKNKLQGSLDSKQAVSVTLDSAQLNILEVK